MREVKETDWHLVNKDLFFCRKQAVERSVLCLRCMLLIAMFSPQESLSCLSAGQGQKSRWKARLG